MSDASRSRTIVTAADHRYRRTLSQLLLSVERYCDDELPRVVIVDLGLTARDRDHLARRFGWCVVEPFLFDAHPAHVRRLEICAWKPIAIDETIRRGGGLVLWLDSATIVGKTLDPIFDRIARAGVLTLAGQSPIARWCHDDTRRCMNASNEDAAARCRSAGILGFDSSRADVRALVAEWRHFASIQACIDPPGATRVNHRYDQAILSLLLARKAFDDTDGEIDISSARPIRWASTRNKVAPRMPLALDPIVRAYYATYKAADRALIRARDVARPFQGRGRGAESPARRPTLIRDAAFALEDLLSQTLAAAFRAGATRRGRRVLRSKEDVRGRRCHCRREDVHLVHSEGLREACDVVIDYASNVQNPERPQMPLTLVATIASEIAHGDLVHVKTDHLEAFVRDILPRTSGPIMLVTGDSDISPVRRFEHLLDDDRILHWFAQNCDVPYEHPRLTRVPTGRTPGVAGPPRCRPSTTSRGTRRRPAGSGR